MAVWVLFIVLIFSFVYSSFCLSVLFFFCLFLFLSIACHSSSLFVHPNSLEVVLRHLGGPESWRIKIFNSRRSLGDKINARRYASSFIYWIKHNGLLWLSNWRSKYKVRTFDFFWTCRNLHAFWEDQVDPKSVPGRPKPIRNGPTEASLVHSEVLADGFD